ncbi:hypothetical protein ABW19_dt0204812 [Dactylella cylindrospora]|nr:hypothetical protein ABW19_dt0204812 [Dactylella cylindrospora]
MSQDPSPAHLIERSEILHMQHPSRRMRMRMKGVEDRCFALHATFLHIIPKYATQGGWKNEWDPQKSLYPIRLQVDPSISLISVPQRGKKEANHQNLKRIILHAILTLLTNK